MKSRDLPECTDVEGSLGSAKVILLHIAEQELALQELLANTLNLEKA